MLDIDGKPVGVAGYYLAGSRVMVFSDVIEDHGIPKTRIWRESLAFMQKLKMPAICEASEGAAPFLKRLGWKHIRTIQGREIYEWQNS